MLFAAEHTADLKGWLAKELEPICDADPEVLSDYIMALLKHDGSLDELEGLLKEQLEDFLAEQTGAFVAKALDALRNRSYLSAQPDTPVEAESSSNSRKRRAEDDEHDGAGQDDDGDGAPAAKASRSSDVGLPRGPRASAGPSGMALNGRGGLPAQLPRAPKGRDGRPRELCRSYHQKGFCPRGDDCRYEHSSDMLTAGGPGFQGGVPAGAPIHLGGGPQMGMGRPPQGMMPGGGPGFMPGGPQFGGPFPGMQQQQGWNGGQMQGGHQMHPQQQQLNGGSSDAEGSSGPGLAARLGGHASPSSSPHGQFGQPGGDTMMMGGPGGPGPSRGGFMGGQDGGGRGGGRGGMRGGRGGQGTFRQAKSSTTLVIENVPQDSLDLIKVNEYFKRFGTITNIQIDHQGSKALVSFSRPDEAKSAHSSPEAVFGNRFIKVFFQRLDEDGGAQQQQQPQQQHRPAPFAAGGPPAKPGFIPGVTSNVYRPPSATAGPSSAAAGGGPMPNPARAKALEEQRAAQKRVDALMDEQRKLMASVTASDATPEGKKEAMARLKVIGPEFDKAKEEAKEAAQRVSSLPATIPRPAGAGASAAAEGGGDAAKRQEQREKMERAKLDRELELHTKAEGAASSNVELQAKLASLKAEAESLGIDPSAPQAASLRGGFRGRARATFRGGPVRGGYGGFRGGRGGMPVAARGSMSLDNRSTRINVVGLPKAGEAEAGEKREKLKDWLKQFGEVESISDGADASGVVVTFKQRAFGEAAMRSAGEIPGVGNVKMSWAPAQQRSGGGAGGGGAAAPPGAAAAGSDGATGAEANEDGEGDAAGGEDGDGVGEHDGEGEGEGEGEEDDRDWRR